MKRFKSSLIVPTLALVFSTNLNAEQLYTIEKQSLQEAIEQISKQSNIPYMVNGKLLENKKAPKIKDVKGVKKALEKLLKDTALEATIEDGTILIKKKRVKQNNNTSFNDSHKFDDVMVTGELQERSLQDTHTSVAVFSGEELEEKNEESLISLLERTAGASSALGKNNIVLRGINSDGLSGGGGNGSAISTLVDGLRISNTYSASTILSTWDLEQVEVLRGPQSTQTGRNAIAGAIVVKSKDPSFEEEYKIRLAYGNGDTKSMAIAINKPLIDDVLALRFSGDWKQTDGFTKNPTLKIDDYDAEKNQTFRTSLRWEPNDQLSSVLKYTRNKWEESYTPNRVKKDEFLKGNRIIDFDEQEYYNRDIDSINLKVDYDFMNSLKLVSETNYFEHEWDYAYDKDSSSSSSGTNYVPGETDSFEQQIKLSYESEKLKAVLGVFYTEYNSLVSPNTTGLPAFYFVSGAPTGATVDLNQKIKQNTKNHALFGELEYEIYPSLNLIFGARYDKEKFENNRNVEYTSSNPTVSAGLPSGSNTPTPANYHAFLPKIGLVYDFDENASLGFTIQKGYRAGGSGFNTYTGKLVDFNPEYTTNYEISLRSSLFDDRLIVNTNIFYTDWDDQQMEVQGSSGNSSDVYTANAGKSRLFGGELDIKGYVNENLELFTSLAYVKNEFRDFQYNGQQLSGNDFPYAPRITASFGGTYFFNNGLAIGANASYASSYYNDAENKENEKADSRFLVNTNLSYSWDEWTVSAYATNLFDNDYILQYKSNDTVLVGDPRKFGVTLSYKF